MADEPDDLDDDDTEDDDTDNESENASGDEYTPPDKAEWERTRAALAKANGEAKKHRLAAKAAREAAVSNSSAGGTGEDVEVLKRAAAKEVEDRYVPRIKRSAAKTALVAAGLVDADKADVLKSAVRLVELDALDVDEDGDVEGLDEAITDLKAKFPAMFKKARAGGNVRTGSRSGGGTGGTTGGDGGKPKSSASKLAATLGK